MQIMEYMKKREVQMVFGAVILSTLFFGLGYLYARQENPAPILIQKANK